MPSGSAVADILTESVDQFAREQLTSFAADRRTEHTITQNGSLVARITTDPGAQGAERCATHIEVTDRPSWEALIDLQNEPSSWSELRSEEEIREAYSARCEAESAVLMDLIAYLETDFSVAEHIAEPITDVMAQTVAVSASHTTQGPALTISRQLAP
ncbi:hypothetical protein [Nesterenkonia pannonica]|uniref:hypothetical protein n=1 Tax=Nesterenkonia pannonica TaxID=1548602 RepID=UPI00216487F8|nr:hypothetical protein [Nesterenkonia pannonica]